jgi:hypothetical protein
MVGPVTLGIAASGPGGHILRLIISGDLNKYKFNQNTRPIHVLPSVKSILTKISDQSVELCHIE